MQKLIIFIMAAFMIVPPVSLTPTKAEAQVTLTPAHGHYGRPHYRPHHRPNYRPHYRPHHRPYYGRPYYGYDNRYYKRRRNNDAVAAGIAGLAVGAIVAGAAAQNNAPYRASRDHHSYCYSRYRSYDARTGTFVGYDGRRHYCRSPY